MKRSFALTALLMACVADPPTSPSSVPVVDAGGEDSGAMITLDAAAPDGAIDPPIAPTPGCTNLLGTTGGLPPGSPTFGMQTSSPAIPSCKHDALGLFCGLPENAMGESYAVENGTPNVSGTLVVSFDFEFVRASTVDNVSFAQLQVQGSNKLQFTFDPSSPRQVALQIGLAKVNASLSDRPRHRARIAIQPLNKLKLFPATLFLDGMEYKLDIPEAGISSNLVQLGVYYFGSSTSPLPSAVGVRYPRLRVEACP